MQSPASSSVYCSASCCSIVEASSGLSTIEYIFSQSCSNLPLMTKARGIRTTIRLLFSHLLTIVEHQAKLPYGPEGVFGHVDVAI